MFKTKNSKLIPIHITIIGLCSSTVWMIWGMLSNMDWNVISPNICGT